MSKTYTISDTHFGHKSICKYRTEFTSADEHDQHVHTSIMSVSNKRNSLWLLGDCFFTIETLKYLEEYVKTFETVNWIFGNHDTDNSERQSIIRIALKEFNLNKVGSMFKYGKNFWLTHHPMHPDELRGRINIHGHVHKASIMYDAEYESAIGTITLPELDPRYINVCAEVINYTPVDMQTLVPRKEKYE